MTGGTIRSVNVLSQEKQRILSRYAPVTRVGTNKVTEGTHILEQYVIIGMVQLDRSMRNWMKNVKNFFREFFRAKNKVPFRDKTMKSGIAATQIPKVLLPNNPVWTETRRNNVFPTPGSPQVLKNKVVGLFRVTTPSLVAR